MEQEKKISVLDIVIALTKAIKETPNEYFLEDGKNRLWGAKYLLGQVLRQYRIDDNHIFVSVQAKALWDKVTDGQEEMYKYNYTMGVPVHCECLLDLYKGASKTPFASVNFKEGDKFQYRQVFHDEHIIPIEMIIKHLTELDDLNYENVQGVLNNIYMCRILKSENIKLNQGNRNKREWNMKETIEKIYKESHGIEIVGWDEIKKKL